MYCKIEKEVNEKTGRYKYRADYTYNVIKNGKKKPVHTRTGWFNTRKEAMKKAEEMYELKNNKLVEEKTQKSELTIGDLMNDYFEDLKATSLDILKAGTKRTHIGTMNTLIEYTPAKIKKCKISKFTDEHMEMWLHSLATRVLEKTGQVMDANYYSRHRTEIKRIFAYGKNNLYFQGTNNLYKSCLDAIRYDKETRKTLSVYRKAKREFRYWTYAEFRQFLAMNKDLDGFKAMDRAFHPTKFEFSREYMYYVMFNFFFFTGVRTEELRGITWDDIIYNDDRLDEVDINKAFTNHVCEADREEYIKNHHNLKNNESCRRVPILPELKYILEEYRIYFETYFEDIGDKFLFFGQNGPESLLGYNTIDNQIKKRIKSSKVRYISKHDFRRSCAMFLIVELGCDESEIYRFFGHKDMKMLQDVYAEKDRLRQGKKLNDTLFARLKHLSEHREGCAFEKFDFITGKAKTIRTHRSDINNYYDRVPYGTTTMLPRTSA